jgi:predicted dehydrogenase
MLSRSRQKGIAMKIGLIGNRGHQEYVFEGLRRCPWVSIVAISSGTDEDEIEPLKTRCLQSGQKPSVYADYHDLLDRGDITAVSIAGPFYAHARMSQEALEREIHVFCEKPVALNLEDLAVLKGIYQDHSELRFTAMLGLRYDPAFYTAWNAVQHGAIGETRLIHAQKSYKLGTRPDYYRQRSTYGGTIPWVGSHAIDWVHWFSGTHFLSVTARHSKRHNRDLGELEASAVCMFELANDIYATVNLDYFRPTVATTHGDDRLRVVGSDGVVEVRQGRVFLTNLQAGGEKELEPGCERQIFCDFIAGIEGKTVPLLNAWDAFIVTEACLLARQSADESSQIHFQEQING